MLKFLLSLSFSQSELAISDSCSCGSTKKIRI